MGSSLKRSLSEPSGANAGFTKIAVADSSAFRSLSFPPSIIEHAVWLFFRFMLSYGDVRNSWLSVASRAFAEREAGSCWD
jgi:hypothetical protein